ncbi:MAG: hypothetical protein ACD_72C00522G0001, partial [uncultured bacterium]
MVSKKVVGLALVVTLTAFYLYSAKINQKPNPSVVVEATEVSPTRLDEATNSDGSLKLVGERVITGERARYSFKIFDSQKNSSLLLFDTVADPGQTFVIPFNSWSSDNKYLFIQKNDLNGKDYYVFKADGGLFDDGKKFLEVGEYWKQSKNMDVIDHVSGW